MKLQLSLLSLLAFTLFGCSPSGVCTASELTAALAEAAPGDTVLLGACPISGAFTVPAGVAVEGTTGTVLTSIEGSAPILDVSVATGSRVDGVELAVDHGGMGIRGRGEGTLSLSRLTIRVTRGIGVGLRGVGAELRDVEVSGPITEANALFASTNPAETGTVGLVMAEVGAGSVSIARLHVSGFSVAAVAVGGGTLTWEGSVVANQVDVDSTGALGIGLFGTHATLTSVAVENMFSGLGQPGVAIAVGPDASGAGTLDATELSVESGEGYGIFADHARVTLTTAAFSGLGLAGVRIQGGTLSATDLDCMGNGGAGILAIDAESIEVERGRLDAQRNVPFNTAIGSQTIGDGLEIVRDPMSGDLAPPLDLRLVDVTFAGNERAGLVLDAANGAIARLELIGVSVTSEGTGLGAITQRASPDAGWDAMVSRSGAALTNDATFTDTISVLGIMMPPASLPDPLGL